MPRWSRRTATLANTGNVAPYLYRYDIEDILSWTCSKPEEPSEFQAVLLRDTVMQFDQSYFLPTVQVQRYRYLWINPDTGKVNLQFYDIQAIAGRSAGPAGGAVELELTRIPFVMLDIGNSLIKDVCGHQIALLNLGSSDVSYALRSNFPFYIEQKDLRAVGAHLKHAATADGTATTGGQGAAETDIQVGATHGRSYDKGMNPPAFINPSAEPLRASLELQDAAQAGHPRTGQPGGLGLAVRASAESKAMDNQGLEAGLSYIGLLLESAERQLCEHWAAYEERVVSKREVATIKYPDRYSLKTDADRIKEATDLTKLMNSVPGRKVKRELSKGIVQALLGGKVSVDDLEAINRGDRQRPLHQQRPADDHPGGAGGTGRREDGFRGPGLRRRRIPGGPQGPRRAAEAHCRESGHGRRRRGGGQRSGGAGRPGPFGRSQRRVRREGGQPQHRLAADDGLARARHGETEADLVRHELTQRVRQ